MDSEERIYIASSQEEALRQGEIISDLIQARLDLETINSDQPRVEPIIHPFAIIVSQDCDLDFDFKARNGEAKEHKLIPNILFCEAMEAEKLRGRGTDTGMNSKTWQRIKINKDERYHFLQKVEISDDVLKEGLPELGVDFRRYFTIPVDEVYARIKSGEAQRRCRLVSPYLEHFSTRFAYYQYRVALPSDHYSEPE